MKKNVAYILALVMAFSLLAGCGNVVDRNPVVTNSPRVTSNIMPDVNDGILADDDNGLVDNDGIIEDNRRIDDNGNVVDDMINDRDNTEIIEDHNRDDETTINP